MAYRGTRDPETGLLIPVNACIQYTSKNAGNLIECFIPPEHIKDYQTKQWGSIMVKPEQVRHLQVSSEYIRTIAGDCNMVYVNDGAEIKVTTKDDRHVTLTTEVLYPTQIMARWFKFFRFERYQKFTSFYFEYKLEQELDCPSDLLAKDYAASGLTAPEYLNRLPLIVR